MAIEGEFFFFFSFVFKRMDRGLIAKMSYNANKKAIGSARIKSLGVGSSQGHCL
jgi:hypothetical protein